MIHALLIPCEDRTQPISVESLVDIGLGNFVEFWSASGVDMGPVLEITDETLTIASGGVRVRWSLAELDGGEVDADGRVVLFHRSIREMP